MSESEIIDKILVHLQGYVLDSTVNDDYLTDFEYDKKVTETEVMQFYEIAKTYALTYMNRTEFPYTETIEEEVTVKVYNPIICNATYMWCAGLIWNKYDLRVNNQTDDTSPLGYGDKLIIQSKEMLKPFKYYNMKVY